MRRQMLRVKATGAWLGIDQQGIRAKSPLYEGPFEVDVKDGVITQCGVKPPSKSASKRKARQAVPVADLDDLMAGIEPDGQDG